MDPRAAASHAPDPDAVEFVRFCHRRRRVGWPELYDEMCAVAARGLFRGYSADDLGAHGIGLGLFDMPALAALTRDVLAAELAARRPVQVAIRALDSDDTPAGVVGSPAGSTEPAASLPAPALPAVPPRSPTDGAAPAFVPALAGA
ncbi:MAG: hypothetical protein ACLGIJ_08615 [Candidatus Limnocylindria bacterium]